MTDKEILEIAKNNGLYVGNSEDDKFVIEYTRLIIDKVLTKQMHIVNEVMRNAILNNDSSGA